MWSVKVITLLLFCYGCLSTGNTAVHFVSRNFNNTLHWQPAKPAFPGEKMFYSVWYWSDAKEQPYHLKEECRNITALSCDLTAETPSVPDVHYVGWVCVNGRNHGHTHRFKPLRETTLGEPILTARPTTSSLHVNVTLPSGPEGVSIADIISGSRKGPSRTVFVYTLKITEPKWAAQVHENTTGHFIINLKNNHTEYCGYVVYKPSIEWGRSESEPASFCVTLSDPLKLLPWLLMSAALLAAIAIVAAVCMCNYVKIGKKKIVTPQSITVFSIPPDCVMEPPDRDLVFFKPEPDTRSHITVYATIRAKPNVPPLVSDGYSPQDLPWQSSIDSSSGSCADNSTSNPEDTSAQSSQIYSTVEVHVPAAAGEDDQQGAVEDRETGSLPPSPNWDNESDTTMPLLLQTMRDPTGQLILPSLAFQSQPDKERGPLLSDLIDSKREGPSFASLQSLEGSDWSDSGCDDSISNTPTQTYCNSHFLRSQPVAPNFQPESAISPSSEATCESGYKQNWIQPILVENASSGGCGYSRKTNHPWTWTASKSKEECEEEEDCRGEERSSQILLGNWVLKIQE